MNRPARIEHGRPGRVAGLDSVAPLDAPNLGNEGKSESMTVHSEDLEGTCDVVLHA